MQALPDGLNPKSTPDDLPAPHDWELGIIGYPLGYSLSPLMHRAALKAAGLAGKYREVPIEPQDLSKWLETQALELDGFNATMPHKRAVWHWIKFEIKGTFGDPKADLISAVNTVVVKEGRPVGYNTDGSGFRLPLQEMGIELKGREVVLLGSGGGAQAIAFALEEDGVGKLTIWNREKNLVRAEGLAKRINGQRGSEFAFPTGDLDALPVEGASLLVNATPLGMPQKGQIPGSLLEKLHAGQLVYDVVYEPRETKLIQTARQNGCQTITGDAMLAGQGAASFELWTGVSGMLPVMRQALDEQLNAGPAAHPGGQEVAS